MMSKESIVIIGGGVGPLAGVEFHKKLIQHTNGDGSDQNHLDVIHVSRAHDIANRIDFLEGRSTDNPADGMCRSIKMAADTIHDTGRDAVIAIPCNTFHVPSIYDRFLELLQQQHITFELIHIIDEVIDSIIKGNPETKKVGLITTVALRKTRLFQDKLAAKDLTPVDVPAKDHELIQENIWEIKKANAISPKIKNSINRNIDYLGQEGAEIVIIGCSEISMVFDNNSKTSVPLIDPLDTLARATIEKVRYSNS